MEPQPPIATAPTPQPSPVPPKPKNNSLLTVLLSILLLLATSIAFFFAIQVQKLTKQLTQFQTPPNPTPLSTEIPSPTPDPTANWKIFESSDKKLTFKYPENWYTQPLTFQGNVTFGITSLLINNQQYDTAVAEPSSVNIQYWSNPNKLSLEQFQSQIDAQGGRIYNLYKPTEQSTIKVKINGIEGYYIAKSDCEPFTCAGYVVNTGNRIYEIKIFPSTIKYKEIVDQILSTFKFLD